MRVTLFIMVINSCFEIYVQPRCYLSVVVLIELFQQDLVNILWNALP